MAVFKCKICGGTLEVLENESVFECQYCGSIQTLPKLTNDRINNLYDRANHFRRNNEFDKALALYEKILLEDTTDAEVYWSIVLCKYGIEYVEDPQTKKRVPTIHRAQYTSVLADTDYKLALQYADEKQKRIYEQEASYIDEVQKGILEISLKEEPFDVFICYKEYDENGNRTPDSALASELYYELTEMGFKVFFSRITLEDKLGIAYEPYIFAALNSSKVMVVIGTKPEYLNAVWVKNEWSRYLSLIKNGEKKLLIPAYKGMDPYDLPEEFSHLQAQDMNRLGFMFDLLHVIKKVVNTQKQEVIDIKPVEQIEEVKVEPKKVETTDYDLPVNVDALLERAFMFLEDQDWSEAEEYCDRVLDYQPKNAMAYVGKLLADLGVEKLEWLKDYKEEFDDNRNYQRAIQFADPTLRRKLEGSLQTIIDRKKESKYSKIYKKAVEKMDDADSRDELGEALKMFREIRGYKNTDVYIKQLEEEIEDMKYSSMYENAKRYQSYNNSEELKKAIDLFEELKNYKDSKKKLEECKTRYEKVKVEEEKRKQEQEIEEKLRMERNERLLKIVVSVALITLILSLIISTVTKTKRQEKIYNSLLESVHAEEYDDAYNYFKKLDMPQDPSTELLEALYTLANHSIEHDYYKRAIALYECLGNYRDSQTNLEKCERMEYFSSAKVGKTLYFGETKDIPYEWIVLQKINNTLLIATTSEVTRMEFTFTDENNIWETSNIREWLNTEFYEDAFSDIEKQLIRESDVVLDVSTLGTTTRLNKSTKDKIFLLSESELRELEEKYKKCEVNTSYYVDNKHNGYWLRTPYHADSSTIYLQAYNNLKDYASINHIDLPHIWGIRPAMWIDTSQAKELLMNGE